MSPAVSPEHLRLAERAARVIQENRALRDAELLALLACEPDELRAVIPIVIRWRKDDQCGDYLVADPRQRDGRPGV